MSRPRRGPRNGRLSVQSVVFREIQRNIAVFSFRHIIGVQPTGARMPSKFAQFDILLLTHYASKMQ